MEYTSESLDFLLSQIIREHFIRVHYLLGKIGLHKGQPPILFMLWERDGLTQKEIAKELKLKPSTVTVMLKRMERAGFLKREPDLQDMRVSRVYLTEKGKIIKKDVEDINLILENDCFSGFTLEEKILLRRFFLQILDNLQKVNKRENAYDKRCL